MPPRRSRRSLPPAWGGSLRVVLVDKAGSTMNEVVAAIRRVTDIVGVISAANSEQSSGVAQVGEAVTQMDQATQQNAALVEQMAAAAHSLRGQSNELVQSVAVFRLPAGSAVARAPVVASTRRTAPASAMSKPKALARFPVKPLALRNSVRAPAAISRPKPGSNANEASNDWESF